MEEEGSVVTPDRIHFGFFSRAGHVDIGKSGVPAKDVFGVSLVEHVGEEELATHIGLQIEQVGPQQGRRYEQAPGGDSSSRIKGECKLRGARPREVYILAHCPLLKC